MWLAAEHFRQFGELTAVGIRSEFGTVGTEEVLPVASVARLQVVPVDEAERAGGAANCQVNHVRSNAFAGTDQDEWRPAGCGQACQRVDLAELAVYPVGKGHDGMVEREWSEYPVGNKEEVGYDFADPPALIPELQPLRLGVPRTWPFGKVQPQVPANDVAYGALFDALRQFDG